jgi:Ca-activated chloride channel family protein
MLVPLAFWSLRGRGSTRLPGLQLRVLARRSQAVWGPRLLGLLRALTIASLIIAVARPQTVDARTHAHSDGIAIQLVLDTSNSMGYTDYVLEGRTVSRMDAARHAIRLFVKGDPKHNLPGRVNDLIGLVTFSRHPDVACPLTHSHATLLMSLDQVTLGPHTNIGDGLAWGIDRLRKAEAKERVVILLSDGKQNLKDALNPEEAARLAAELGIRIYSIGAIGNRRTAIGYRPSAISYAELSTEFALAGGRQPMADSIDEGVLRRVAEKTGGKYYRATDADGLLAIYREIDLLETSRLVRSDSVVRTECYLWPLIAGLLLLALEQLLGATRFLVVP